MQIGLYLDWPLSHSGYHRLDGGHSETPRRAGDIHPLSGREKDTPTQSVDDYCACVQLPNGLLAGWSEIGCSCWPISEGGGVFPFGLRHSMGLTGGGDVSDCVHTMVLELPVFLVELENLKGLSPNVHLHCEPWGHINHEDID